MFQPVISVIVPVHNTAAFLPRCLESLEAQTFSDFEVILVDDGSTDGSADICDAFAGKHDHARVICHGYAKGVSAARNVGVAEANGAFIGFVDSDDWAAPTMFETLHRVIAETGSEVAQVCYKMCSGPEEAHGTAGQEETVRVLSSGEALAEMFLKEEYAVWNRLYRRDLFDAYMPNCFPEGLTCEDRVGNVKLLSAANKVAVSSRIEYFYFQNLGSISYNGLDTRGLDLLEADRIVVELASAVGDAEVLELARDRAAKGSFSLLVKWARFGVTDPSLDEASVLPVLFDDFRANYRRLMKSSLPFAKKAAAWQLRHCPSLLRFEFRMLDALVRRGR